MTVGDTLKKSFWAALSPVFPYIQHGLLKSGIIRHKGRQPYLLGRIHLKNFHGFKHHLEKQGFGNHFIAWEDSDQILGWRKRTDFGHQYHIRIFKDGEVRGHFELTPERNPLKHFFEVGQKSQREDFFKFFGEWVMPVSETETMADLDRYRNRHSRSFNEY